ncbi:MAG: Hint domain-containing protein [Elusimicrobia bacterium]|nr:Hint domain-containing protein [Elusimicrobiota bacterium]
MPDDKESERARWLAVATVLAISVTAGVAIVSSPPRPGSSRRTDARSSWPPPEKLSAKARLQASAPAASPAPVEESEFDKLLNLFAAAERSSPETTQAFKKEFMKEPELREEWQKFSQAQQRKDGPPPTIDDFAEALVGRHAFRRLVSKFSSDPGFRELATAFTRQALVQNSVRKILASGTTAARQTVRGPTRSSARGGGAFSYGIGAGGARSAAAGGATGAGGAASAVAGGGRAGAGTAGPGRDGGSGSSADAGKAQNAVPLADLEGADDGKDVAHSIASLCIRHDPAISHDQCEAINNYLGPDDIWQSCQKAGLLTKCASLCAGRSELDCQQQGSNIQSCLAAGEPSAFCASNCTPRPDCSMPPPPPPPPVGASSAGTGTGGNSGGGQCAQASWTDYAGCPQKCMPNGVAFIYARTCNCAGGQTACSTCRMVSCFPAGTKIAAPDGERPIEALRPGDPVFAVEPVSGRLLATVVAANSRRGGQTLIQAFVSDGGSVQATAEHPFWDPDAREFRPLGQWKPGQRMLRRASPGAPLAPVTLLRIEPVAGEHEVFNLSVEDARRDFVADGFLVHNKALCK